MKEPLINATHLNGGYGQRLVLHDINLHILPNTITAILGTSGCGKTTLLKHLIGLLPPMEGTVRFLGEDLFQSDEKELNRLRNKMGVLFQNGALLNSLPVSENLAIPFEQHTNLPREMIEQLVRQKLHLVGLSSAYDLLPSQLSGGMRKRAALARAIALDPLILFADEPNAGLDPVTAKSLDQLLLSLKVRLNITVVLVTHEIISIKRIAEHVIYLHEGRILFDGSLSAALNSTIEPVQNFFTSD